MSKKIVIIDDEPAFCQLLKTMINNTGTYIVDTFSSSQKALDSIKVNRPDAVFVDLLMPECDGGSVIKSINDFENYNPYIVTVTGMVIEDKLIDLNSPILSKPINSESLLKVLNQISEN